MIIQSANIPEENFFNPSVNVTLPKSIKLNSIFSSSKKSENASSGDSTLMTSATSVFGLSAEKTNVTSMAKLNRSEMCHVPSAAAAAAEAAAAAAEVVIALAPVAVAYIAASAAAALGATVFAAGIVSGRLITFGSEIQSVIQTWAVNFEQYGSAVTAVGKAQLA